MGQVTISSRRSLIQARAEKLYAFLADFGHFGQLMPPQITRWENTEDTCSFNIQGMADIDLRISRKEPFSLIHVVSEGRTPFPITLTWHFTEEAAGTETGLDLVAELNPMLSMMVKAPLENFVNILVDKLKQKAEAGEL